MSWLPKHNVVVPCDFSDESITAIDTVLEMVGSPGQAHVIHVLPELSAGDPSVVWGTIDDESRRDHATAALENLLSDEKYQPPYSSRNRDSSTRRPLSRPRHNCP